MIERAKGYSDSIIRNLLFDWKFCTSKAKIMIYD